MNLTRIIQEVQPDEIYNLAAMSHVKVSFDTPEYTANADGIGALRLLEAIRLLGMTDKTRISFYIGIIRIGAGDSTERNHTFYPRSLCGSQDIRLLITVNYRKPTICTHAMEFYLTTNRRWGETFVTRKITRAAARIALGMQDKLYLGNLSAQRDWGHAKDYVRAIPDTSAGKA